MGQKTFLNFYYCPDCDSQWEEAWDSMCNDKCGCCNKEIEPFKSEILPDTVGVPFKSDNALAPPSKRDSVKRGEDKMKELPRICPMCQSESFTPINDYDDFRRCNNCDATWYWSGSDMITIPGDRVRNSRKAMKTAFRDADERYYGMDGGW